MSERRGKTAQHESPFDAMMLTAGAIFVIVVVNDVARTILEFYR